ncbi:MAG: tRNA pseudouridine(38-40) synthase TruA [Planctomycetes bacterium]|nr:tRNA pseudouridine(38-40) synthase TruA [Planctomycetota bacterium]
MRNVRFQVSYDGSLFFGWQRQDGFISVQEAIEDAVAAATGRTVVIHGAGRTDTGVHALRMVAHMHIDTGLSDDRLRHALNAHVREGIAIPKLETCRDDFHARFDAVSKRYMYVVATSRFEPVFGRQLRHWTNHPLELEPMQQAARALVGKHDFKGFGNTGSPRKTTVRTVHRVRLVAYKERVVFFIQADGFLYNMVRTIVGTLLDVGRGRRAADCVARTLASGERVDAGATAPARGLYFLSAQYDEPVFSGSDAAGHGHPGVFRL